MGITVKELCKRFSEIKDYEIKQLAGKSDFKDSDVIPLNNFAQCQKMKYKFFAAEREKQGFINLLKGSEQVEVAKNTGITPPPAKTSQNITFENNNNLFVSSNRNAGSGLFSQSLFTMKKAV